jgi:S-phase kinase-associated protein 1
MNQKLKFVRLVTKEKEFFNVELEIISLSNFLKNIYEEFKNKSWENLIIPLYNIETKVLAKIIEYCRYEKNFYCIKNIYYKKKNNFNFELFQNSSWAKEFLKINKHMIIPIIKAASYLDIEKLLFVSTKILAEKFVQINNNKLHFNIFII